MTTTHDPSNPTYQALADALLLAHTQRCMVAAAVLEVAGEAEVVDLVRRREQP
jgi:hypothetical protein